MLVTKYKPTTFDQFVGNITECNVARTWLQNWNYTQKQKALLIYGHNGVGKTTLSELLTSEMNVVYISPDDDNIKEKLETASLVSSVSHNISSNKNIIVANDIDCIEHRGFISSLLSIIKNSKIPVICICDNRYDQSLKSLIPYCLEIKLGISAFECVYALLYRVIVSEKIRIKKSQVRDLYDCANGDIRFMLNTLELYSVPVSTTSSPSINHFKNIQSSSMFETTTTLLNVEEPLENKYNTFWTYRDLHLLMVQENYVNNILSINQPKNCINNIANCANALSTCDIIEHTNGCSWGDYDPYVACNLIMATSLCNKKTMIKFPQYFTKMSSTRRTCTNTPCVKIPTAEKIYKSTKTKEKPKLKTNKETTKVTKNISKRKKTVFINEDEPEEIISISVINYKN